MSVSRKKVRQAHARNLSSDSSARRSDSARPSCRPESTSSSFRSARTRVSPRCVARSSPWPSSIGRRLISPPASRPRHDRNLAGDLVAVAGGRREHLSDRAHSAVPGHSQPLARSGVRFEPSCSRYMIESLKKHGLVRGLARGMRRLSQCHPWNPGGLTRREVVPPVGGAFVDNSEGLESFDPRSRPRMLAWIQGPNASQTEPPRSRPA